VLVCGLLLCGICFIIKSNMGLCIILRLCISVYMSFVCSFCLVRLRMWKRSHIFNRGPFFQCEVCPLFLLLCHMCVVYLIYVLQI
jgi:hypothetical protein